MSEPLIFNLFKAETWNIAADFNHIAHPKTCSDKYQEPSLGSRIGGSILLALSFLVVVPACLYLYWACKKVEHIETPKSNSIEDKTQGAVLNKIVKTKTPSSSNVASQAIAQMGGTYDEAIACCDYAYSNAVTGTFGVFDAAGHNKQHIHDDQVPLFTNFFKGLSCDLSAKRFNSIEEAQEFLKSHFEKTAPDFVELSGKYAENPEAKYAAPALFAGFVTTINGQPHFIGGQMADCCLCHRAKGGEVTFYRAQDDIGLGDHPSRKNPSGRLPTSICFPVGPGSELFAFSDGIGEFVSDDEFLAVINKNQDRKQLLEDFHQAITEDLKVDPTHSSKEYIAQKPKGLALLCKQHDGQNSKLHDDISIAYLKI